MLWDLLSGFVLFLLRFLAFSNGMRSHCAAFASAFPSVQLRNLPHVATRRIGVHRRPRETAFAPFSFSTRVIVIL
jgi:hypothetical protein